MIGIIIISIIKKKWHEIHNFWQVVLSVLTVTMPICFLYGIVAGFAEAFLMFVLILIVMFSVTLCIFGVKPLPPFKKSPLR